MKDRIVFADYGGKPAFFAVKQSARKRYLSCMAVCLFLSVGSLRVSAQQPDTNNIHLEKTIETSDTIKEKIHSPKKAAWMSAVLPGLGQGYNKKYWKIPVVYAGFTGTTFGIVLNYQQYKIYRDEYRYRLNHKGERYNPSLNDWDDENVNVNKQNYQRNMELFILVTAAWYLINIIDAVVDAHLISFDISDNLSLNVLPAVAPAGYQYSAGSLGYKSFVTTNISFIFNLK
jgi:hypothetical protein